MGSIHYGGEIEATIDDETLAHVSAVAVAKLRRREPFLLTLLGANGRESLWVHTASTLRFGYASNEAPALDRDRLGAMMAQANRATGLVVECAAEDATLASELARLQVDEPLAVAA